jgi:hypothetical protein
MHARQVLCHWATPQPYIFVFLDQSLFWLPIFVKCYMISPWQRCSNQSLKEETRWVTNHYGHLLFNELFDWKASSQVCALCSFFKLTEPGTILCTAYIFCFFREEEFNNGIPKINIKKRHFKEIIQRDLCVKVFFLSYYIIGSVL